MQRYFCDNLRRRDRVRDTLNPDSTPRLNGLDYLEVSESQTTLTLHFIHVAPPLTAQNIEVVGGTRIRDIRVNEVAAVPEQPNRLQVSVNQPGDFSTYRLRLVTSSVDDALPTGFAPPLDPQLSDIPFSFKVDCPSSFDCPEPPACPTPNYPQPHIDYLAKDYASFRQLMLDRLAVTLPGWTERNPADVGVAIVEVLAYAADYLSYYQDAAATEAYLGTARRRASVRRHAQLLNYPMHEGCNARTWISLQTEIDNLLVDKGTLFFTRAAGQPSRLIPGSRADQEVRRQRPAGFDAMHGLHTFRGHNQVAFYTWSDENCCLPKGATHATLLDNAESRLHLRPGDVIVLSEARSPSTGRKEDADITHRQAVRLTAVHPAATEADDGRRTPGSIVTDPLTGLPVVEIRWHSQDALLFALCLSKEIGGELKEDMAIAHANILLADHGQPPPPASQLLGGSTGLVPNTVPEGIRYRPRIADQNITYAAPFELSQAAAQSASAALRQDPRQALPAVQLTQDNGTIWEPVRSLLNSDRFDEKFVLEPDSTRRATLRFGDGVFGQVPAPLTRFEAIYRVGNGTAGNIGAEAIAHIVSNIAGITAVSNPLPGTGGTEPEPIAQVKLDAPQAFRTQERAVTEADFAALSLRHPDVQQAVATRRWTGSWYTYFVTVDRKGGRPVDAAFEQDFRRFLERFRLAGYDLEVDAPQFVPLDLRFAVCVQPGYFPGDVEAALLETFSNRDWPDGRRGFFHPDNFTFGQPLYLSAVVAAAMAVPGVQWIETAGARARFQRWGRTASQELENGEITFERLEIARLDNDPNAPENGRIEFIMEGGR